jgi:hypothetical protein
MDNNIIEINLEPSENSQTRVSTSYEDAFLGGGSEEMSNARGKGRARRKSRKLERISNKREVRTERRKLKSDRDSERIARRKTRKKSRQEIRDDQQEARMSRKNKRMEAKENRKGSDEDEDEVEDEVDAQTTPDASEDEEDTGSTGGSTASEDDEEDTGSGSTDEQADDEEADDEEENFSGRNYDFDGEANEFISEATGESSIPPFIQEICMKIEWNNEMLMRLAQQKKKMLADGRDVSKVDTAIDNKFDRVKQLEGKLENFTGADGRKAVSGKQVMKAKRKARRERLEKVGNVIPPVLLVKLLKKGVSKAQAQEWWKKKGKNRFGKDKSSFNGMENSEDRVIYTDEPVDMSNWGSPSYVDVDMSANSGVELMSLASGEKPNNFWKSLLVGVIVGGALIYVVRKYKLLKD